MKKNEKGFFEIEENKKNLTREDYTGEVLFSTLYLSQEFDYFLSYKALFWKGDLREINLEDASKEDNSHRKEMQEALSCKVSELQSKRSQWWFSPLKLFRYAVRFTTFSIRWFLGWIVKATWKIEKWMG